MQRNYNAPYNVGGFGNSGFQNSRYERAQKPKRKSGAAYGIGKNQKPFVRGWKATKRFGMVSFFASPYHNTHEFKSRSGKLWETWIMKITYRDQMREEIVPCLYNPLNHSVHVGKYNLLVKPSTPGGGWSGFLSKNR